MIIFQVKLNMKLNFIFLFSLSAMFQSSLSIVADKLSNHRQQLQKFDSKWSNITKKNLPIQLVENQNWICSFIRDDCGIINQKLLMNFTLIANGTLCDERGVYMLNIEPSRQRGARLITPYFQTNSTLTSWYQRRCLKLRYIVFGDDVVDKIIIWQQNMANRILWRGRPISNGHWNTIQIHLNFLPRIASRFFFEIQTVYATGFFALARISIENYCGYKQ